MELKYVKMYCNTNQFPALHFCGPHSKPHGARGLGKHYHLSFDPKLGMDICAIRRIPCACVACTSMLDKTWISGIPSGEQESYKTVTNCTYWPVLWAFKIGTLFNCRQSKPHLTHLMNYTRLFLAE